MRNLENNTTSLRFFPYFVRYTEDFYNNFTKIY